MFKKITTALLFTTASLGFTTMAYADHHGMKKDVVEVAVENGSFTTLEMLLKPENKDKLTAVLTYHVVSGKVMAADVMKVDSAKTLQGQSVMVKADSMGVMINDAKVVKADVKASNGVIHVIDTVLLPKE